MSVTNGMIPFGCRCCCYAGCTAAAEVPQDVAYLALRATTLTCTLDGCISESRVVADNVPSNLQASSSTKHRMLFPSSLIKSNTAASSRLPDYVMTQQQQLRIEPM